MSTRFSLFLFTVLVSLLPAFTPHLDRAHTFSREGQLSLLKYNNPGAVSDLGVGLWAWPLPMDYDRDGDMDMLVSCADKPFNGTWFFENKSGEAIPVFEAPVRLNDALKDVQLSYVNGKPRVLIPGAEIDLVTGRKEPLLDSDIVTREFAKRPRFNQWKLVDYEGDGDEDIIVAIDDWTDYGWDNAYDEKGHWTNGPLHGYLYLLEKVEGEYVNRGRMKAGGAVIDLYGAPSPNFADFDRDGDLDIICGEFLDRLTWFENKGSREAPRYAPGVFLSNAKGTIHMDLEMIIPVAVDWDKDGFTDLVVGDEDGRVALVRHTGRIRNGMPVFEDPFYFKQKADNVKFGALATPVGVDWDNDGDEDIITGNSAGYIGFIENRGLRDGLPMWAPPRLLKSNGEVIRIQAGSNGSIQGPAEAKWGYTTLSVADWDADGRKDLIVNSIWGKVVWYRNVGSGADPVLADAAPVKVEWGGRTVPRPEGTWWLPDRYELATQWRTTPVAYDWNGDGLTDLVMLDHEGYLCLFERYRRDGELLLTPGKRIFYGVDASGFDSRHRVTDSLPGTLRLNTRNFGSSGRRKLCIADWNRDGRPDFLVNSVNVSLMENVGIRDGNVLIKSGPPLSATVLAGHTTSPTTIDLNRDGRRDLLVGAEDGHFYYRLSTE